MAVVKVTSKGQITIPVEIRRTLGITEDSYVDISLEGDEVHVRKMIPTRPLSHNDPFMDLIGQGESGLDDVSQEHDRYLADGERKRWHGSS